MPLPLPRLDVRTFDQLVAEGQVLLPRSAPSWTDYNAHDPGITLLELLAWLAEMGFYRLDRTPPASYRAFLRLAGIEIRAAQVAETVLFASPKAPATTATVAAGIRAESADGGVAFQTMRDTSISASRLVAVLTGRGNVLADRSRENFAAGSMFSAFGAMPQVDDALYLAFDDRLVNTPAPLSLFVATGREQTDRETRALLQAEWESAYAEALKNPEANGASHAHDARLHYGARVAWEYHAGGASPWQPLANVEDETRSLTLSGIVRFTVPISPSHAVGGVAAAGHESHFFIRCRLTRGRYDCPPEISSVLPNALSVRHAVDIKDLPLFPDGAGRAAQALSLRNAPIVPGTTRIEITNAAVADPPWREAPDWDRAGPHDRVYVVAHDRGDVVFGDGRRGRVPRAGAKFRATYQLGGGPSGNVAPKTLTRLITSPDDVTVVQPFPATGGEGAEDLEAAIGRLLASHAAPSRAVTLRDFEDLTQSMPGVPIARARAIADYDPALPCLPALGHVTVVVVPHCPARRPEPSDALLSAVACYLERRRTITTRLHVVGPRFTTVSVQARLHPLPGIDRRRLADAARTALNRFFDPLRGGPDATGWPVGRDVYRAEVMALLNNLAGVSYVDEVALRVGDEPGARCGNASVCRDALVVSGTHQITIDSGSHCQ